jgi:hypothetical protein
MHEIRFAGMADLTFVLERGEDVGPPQQLQIRLRAVTSNFLEQGLESNHEMRCLSSQGLSCDPSGALGWFGRISWRVSRRDRHGAQPGDVTMCRLASAAAERSSDAGEPHPERLLASPASS